MRTRSWRRAIGVLLAALSMSGAGLVAAPSSAQAGGLPGAAGAVHAQTLTLDGDALRVRPTAVLPTVSRQRARFDLTHSDAGGVDFAPGRILYGAVTITARRTVDPNEPGRYPSFHSTPAWVLFFSPGVSSNCPAAAPAAHPVPVSDRSAMVINARTGTALVYLEAGFGCKVTSRPSVTKVAERLSVPWTMADLPAGTPVSSVTAHYPGCSASFGAAGGSKPGTLSILAVEVNRAFGPCHLPGRPVAMSISGFHVVAPLRHAPVGPITTGRPAF